LADVLNENAKRAKPMPEPFVSPQLVTLPPKDQTDLFAEPQQHWKLPDGRSWCLVFRIGTGYLMRFPDLADFTVAHGNESSCNNAIVCVPTSRASPQTLKHLFVNQVVPAALSIRGRFVFHGSGLVINGVGVGFFGESGTGKSTIATFLACHGYPLLSDDGLELIEKESDVSVLPSHASVRLWQDSRDALLPDTFTPDPQVSHTSKEQFTVSGHFSTCPNPVKFGAAFFLGNGTAPQPLVTLLPPLKAHIAWISNSFLLDVHEKGVMSRQFHRVATIIKNTRSYHLDYPRNYSSLPDVLAAIKKHL